MPHIYLFQIYEPDKFYGRYCGNSDVPIILFQIYETDKFYDRYCGNSDVPIIYHTYFRYMKLTSPMVDIVGILMFLLSIILISDI